MKKILFIVTQSEQGGAQRYIFDLAKNLDKSQFEVHVAAGGEGEFFGYLKQENLTAYKLKHLVRTMSPLSDVLAYFEIKKLVKQLRPDIVHLNSSKAGVLGSLAAKKLKVAKIIYTAHGFVFNEPLPRQKKWLYKKIELANSRRLDKIIAVSDYDRQTAIKAGIHADKLTTIHNGIDPHLNFLTKEEARSKILTILNHPNSQIPKFPNSCLLGCVANLYPTKGLDVLIRAMTKVDAKLIIVGSGPEKKNLQLIAYGLRLNDKIFFSGPIPNASTYLKAFDLFVLPSRKEGLPYVLLEAMAGRVPIVATKVGGVPEIIDDKITGYLAKANNVDDLAEKIKRGLERPLSSHLPPDCVLERMLQKTLRLYRD